MKPIAHNAWNKFKKGGKRSSLPTLAAPRFEPGPVIAIKTLCATKDNLTLTAVWHRKDGWWKLISWQNPLEFLSVCDDYLEAPDLLKAHGWSFKWHDSSMQLPVPL